MISPQIRNLLDTARPGEVDKSFKFYVNLIRTLNENIILVDKRSFILDKYICEMTDDEYEYYTRFLEEIQMGGFDWSEFFYRP